MKEVGDPQTNKTAAPLHPSYRPDIDGLRAVAVLVVLGYHAFPRWVPSGFIGVDVFFVISGFLISTIIMGNLEAGRFSYFDFYSRRIRRIIPALAAMLTAVLAFGWISLFPAELKALGKHVFGGAAFISNFLLWNESGYFDAVAGKKPLLHLWSLGIEEQYYIFWPLILSITWRWKGNLPVVIFLIGAASFVFNLMELRIDPIATFYSPLTRIWELMIGSALAYISIHAVTVRRATGTLMGRSSSTLGAILLLTGFFLISDADAFPGWWAVLPTSGTALLIAGAPDSWINRRILAQRWAVFVGKISFPLYLWHWPLLSFAQIIYGGPPPPLVKIYLLLATFALAWVTYRFIEAPLRHGIYASRVAVYLVTTAIVIAFMGGIVYGESGFPSREIVAYNSSLLKETVFSANNSLPCPAIAEKVISKNKLCTMYPAEHSAKKIVLWGDSSTGAWLPVFLDISKQHNYTIIELSHPSCPPILAARKTRFDYRESREYCKDGQMQAMALKEIARMHPDLIVVIANWNSYSGKTNQEFITDRPDEKADAASTNRTLLTRVPETLMSLTEISPTVVFRSWPIMPLASSRHVSRSLAIPGIKPTESTSPISTDPLSEFLADSQAINSIFDNLKNPRLSFFDPSVKVCGGGACKSQVGGINYYADEYHISTAGAMGFRRDVEALLSR